MLARALHAFSTASFTTPRWFMVGGTAPAGAAGTVRCPVLSFAVELPDRSFVLVDGGTDREREKAARSWGNSLMQKLSPGAQAPAAWTLASRLRELDISVDRVRCAVVTHLDLDHTGGLPALAGRPVLVHRPELANARAPGLFERTVKRQPLEHLAGLDLREFDCALSPAFPYAEGACELPEAEGAVTLVGLPGHTAGQAGALVRLEGGGRVLLCGDACYDASNVTACAPFGTFPRMIAFDRARAERTLLALQAWRRAEPALAVVPSHDPGVGARCGSGTIRL